MSENFNNEPLKTSRFNKFKSSLQGRGKLDTPARITAIKRSRIEDSPDFSAPKRFCSGFNNSFEFQSPSPKNIANARLQKIKERLKQELLTQSPNSISISSKPIESRGDPVPISPKITESKELITGPNYKYISKPVFSPSKIDTIQAASRNNLINRESPKINQTFLRPNTPKNIYQNLDKWISPPDSANKNLASQRMKKLKDHILTPDKSLSTDNKCDKINNNNSIESPSLHRSPLLGIKRRISDDNNGCIFKKRLSTDIADPNSQTFTQVKSPDLNVSKLFSVKQNRDDQLEINKPTQDTPKNVQIHKNINLTNEKIPEDCTAELVQENVQSSTKAKSDDINDHNTNSDSNFKPPLNVCPKPTKSSSYSDTSLSEPSDSFSARMERTALWVKNSLNNTSYVEETVNITKSATGDKLQEKQCEFDDTEEMEWTNAEPDENINQQDEPDENEKSEDIKVSEVKPSSVTLCIVVDTNIFISSLSKLKDILALNIPGPSEIFIYIPWMVMEELDYMKDRCSDGKLKKNIMKSIKFINEALCHHQPKVIGQTVEEASLQKHIGTSQDDKIIACCMQVAEKYENMILLSNDMNLRSKAMINNIAVCPAHEIIMKIMSKFVTNNKSKKILQKMSILCSSIICECAKETYGEVWTKMDLLSCPPWSLLECLKRFRKYWNSVFQDKLMKQFIKTIDDLKHLLQSNMCVSDGSEEYVKFVKLCIKLCIFLKDIEESRGSVEITIRDLTKIG